MNKNDCVNTNNTNNTNNNNDANNDVIERGFELLLCGEIITSLLAIHYAGI